MPASKVKKAIRLGVGELIENSVAPDLSKLINEAYGTGPNPSDFPPGTPIFIIDPIAHGTKFVDINGQKVQKIGLGDKNDVKKTMEEIYHEIGSGKTLVFLSKDPDPQSEDLTDKFWPIDGKVGLEGSALVQREKLPSAFENSFNELGKFCEWANKQIDISEKNLKEAAKNGLGSMWGFGYFKGELAGFPEEYQKAFLDGKILQEATHIAATERQYQTPDQQISNPSDIKPLINDEEPTPLTNDSTIAHLLKAGKKIDTKYLLAMEDINWLFEDVQGIIIDSTNNAKIIDSKVVKDTQNNPKPASIYAGILILPTNLEHSELQDEIQEKEFKAKIKAVRAEVAKNAYPNGLELDFFMYLPGYNGGVGHHTQLTVVFKPNGKITLKYTDSQKKPVSGDTAETRIKNLKEYMDKLLKDDDVKATITFEDNYKDVQTNGNDCGYHVAESLATTYQSLQSKQQMHLQAIANAKTMPNIRLEVAKGVVAGFERHAHLDQNAQEDFQNDLVNKIKQADVNQLELEEGDIYLDGVYQKAFKREQTLKKEVNCEDSGYFKLAEPEKETVNKAMLEILKSLKVEDDKHNSTSFKQKTFEPSKFGETAKKAVEKTKENEITLHLTAEKSGKSFDVDVSIKSIESTVNLRGTDKKIKKEVWSCNYPKDLTDSEIFELQARMNLAKRVKTFEAGLNIKVESIALYVEDCGEQPDKNYVINGKNVTKTGYLLAQAYFKARYGQDPEHCFKKLEYYYKGEYIGTFTPEGMGKKETSTHQISSLFHPSTTPNASSAPQIDDPNSTTNIPPF